ncbi:MAG: DNA recombination protein RmuC [Oscillospiraceae bacterium]|nr:DNA recombination protein RmuC [Oscillospiraceae bacterium]
MDNPLLFAILCVLLILEAVIIIILFKNNKKDNSGEIQNTISENIDKDFDKLRQELNSNTVNNIKMMSDMINQNQINMANNQSDKLNQMEQRLKTFSLENEQKLENIRMVVEKRLTYLQEDNNKQLEKVRETVDEKLQKTLDDKLSKSFELVNQRLEQVYKGLGEMQNLAVGVGDLKKVLSNVKTRGILGEIQLSAILKEILAPEQYEENIATKKGSKNVVEFAIKLPASEDSFVYLPIDSKFPGDTYSALRAAMESGDKDSINSASKALITRIKQEAKDIRDKYISPPETTEFAIMFLPFEGLYSEVVNRGMVEVLQREYKVNIAGPSTMAALLNSLQMGFKTLAVQKRSAEVWKVLGDVKKEFDTFSDVLEKTQQRINQANAELDKLVGVRTRQIQRKLSSVQKLEDISDRDTQENLIPDEF